VAAGLVIDSQKNRAGVAVDGGADRGLVVDVDELRSSRTCGTRR
jgi:hypothetical protein